MEKPGLEKFADGKKGLEWRLWEVNANRKVAAGDSVMSRSRISQSDGVHSGGDIQVPGAVWEEQELVQPSACSGAVQGAHAKVETRESLQSVEPFCRRFLEAHPPALDFIAVPGEYRFNPRQLLELKGLDRFGEPAKAPDDSISDTDRHE